MNTLQNQWPSIATRIRAIGVLAALTLTALACGSGNSEPNVSAALYPSVGAPSWVVPGVGLPAEVTLQDSNNNLDVVRHEGRVFLAFRTSETHFAGPSTVLWVVSSVDELTWRYEGHFALGTDLREPRFLSWQGSLWLYFAVLGTNPAKFEPQGSRVAKYQAPGQWQGPDKVFDSTFIPWRVHVIDDKPLMVGYSGGGNIYDANGAELITVKLLTTDDGTTWRPWVDGTDGSVLVSGGSETDIAVLADGGLVAVVRNEAGDSDGFGAKVCRAPAGQWDQWECAADPKKYDSPQLFTQGGKVWLIGRRSLANEGHYDLKDPGESHNETSTKYQLQWWSSPKRCALWRVDPVALRVTWVADLPSKGDTCFATALPVPGQADTWRIYNYTSPLEGEDINWLQGQLGQTLIYRLDVSFHNSPRTP
ncbi:MAG: hypothetical protein CMH53_10240 [Myxococcales bacterium]|nr:hypothetical protein [Myxococcales bacterium]